MIFATCGTSHYPFDRMMQCLAGLPAADLQVQHGPAEPPRCARAYDYLPFSEIVEQIGMADVVVSHAGVGTILCAIRAGHTPVVIPRLKRYGEAVDDHQAELAAALADHGTVLLATTAEDLAQAIASIPPRRQEKLTVSRPLIDAVHAALLGGTALPSDLPVPSARAA